MKRWTLPLLLVLSAGTVAAHAAGDPAAGETKSASCAGCHGPGGVSANPDWPKLAGQHAGYLEKQLADFKSGKRTNATMAPMAAPLSDQDIVDVSAYFASQKMSTGTAADETQAALGERLYRGGNKDSSVPACMGCHGPAGLGMGAAGFPALSGQHAAYTAASLRNFRTGSRSNDYNGMMRDIASRMSEAEIDAVAQYIAGLR